MKFSMILLVAALCTFATAGFAQTTLRVFEPTLITDSGPETSPELAVAYATTQVQLSCPAARSVVLTGPSGGGFVVDNFLSANGQNVCGVNPADNCFSGLFENPSDHIGQPVSSSYLPIAPIDITAYGMSVGGSNYAYTLQLADWGVVRANSEINLVTNCSIVTPNGQICHRDYGRRVQKTITVGANAIGPHLAHGDTLGPCSSEW